jgi:hypothetical protein
VNHASLALIHPRERDMPPRSLIFPLLLLNNV